MPVIPALRSRGRKTASLRQLWATEYVRGQPLSYTGRLCTNKKKYYKATSKVPSK
jgi:hypothetical protein